MSVHEQLSGTSLPPEGWYMDHFDHFSPQLSQALYPTLDAMRARCPVTRSDQHGGFWVVTDYADVLRIAQDWKTFSSADGVTVPATTGVVPALPEEVDPPIHRVFKRLINLYFTPERVAPYEAPTRTLVTRLIDDFIEDGRCDFMAALARPFPGIAFFEHVLGAPAEVATEMGPLASLSSLPTHPDSAAAFASMFQWIKSFVDQRRGSPPRGDVIDALLDADIDGRQITEDEIIGVIQLIILGGLETTSGALGQIVIRFARHPEIPELLRRQPELIPAAVEELLRLDPPFICIARTVTEDTEVAGRTFRAGEKVVIYYASANHDAAEFEDPERFEPARARNRHLSFGAGPHRCAGSNLARSNMRVALEEIIGRLDKIELDEEAGPIEFHSSFNRAPLTVPICFTPGRRVGT